MAVRTLIEQIEGTYFITFTCQNGYRFDITKNIANQHFFLQKLSYMHNNPCGGVWNLVNNVKLWQ